MQLGKPSDGLTAAPTIDSLPPEFFETKSLRFRALGHITSQLVQHEDPCKMYSRGPIALLSNLPGRLIRLTASRGFLQDSRQP